MNIEGAQNRGVTRGAISRLKAGGGVASQAMNIERVVDRLRAIDHRLPEQDGVRWFNEVYLRVSEQIDADLRAGRFEDRRFMQRLDERFAELYLTALESDVKAWTPLLSARGDTSIPPDRFMLAGINAHVNYDLPLALVEVHRELARKFADHTPRHRDFERINAILAEVEGDMHRRLHTNLIGEIAALWSVVRARDRAWSAALKLHARHTDRSAEEYLDRLGRTVAQWGELLLHLHV